MAAWIVLLVALLVAVVAGRKNHKITMAIGIVVTMTSLFVALPNLPSALNNFGGQLKSATIELVSTTKEDTK